MDIYVKVQHIHSGILQYISKHFDVLYNDPHIGLLSKDELRLLLKHKELSVSTEGQVVESLGQWCRYQNDEIQFKY